MCTTAQAYSNTGTVTISTPNSNLDGSGTLGTVLTALSSGSGGKGTVVESITIKATGNTAQGMIRFFINDGSSTYLFREVYVPANTVSPTVAAFRSTLTTQINLDPGDILYASTETGDEFNIIANATDWKNCDCVDNGAISCGTMQYYSNTGFGNVSTANPNRDGTGTINTILSASSGSLNGGTMVPYVNIKSTGNSSEGMVRLYINDGAKDFLIQEIPIPASTQSEVQPAYRATAQLNIFLKPGYSLTASTENSEFFSLMAFASDWVNCECLTS